jgi:Zn-dependent protease with chaperone function/Tfp pilus assembly protein PilE
MALDPRFVSPKEKRLFVVGAIVSGLAWLGVVVSLVGILYALAGALFFLAAHALFLAHVRTNGVRVDERQLPDLHARVRAAADRLRIEKLPDVYVVHGGGLLNAFATKLLSRRYVILLSDLVDHCEDPRQLDFVVGHELGHLAAGHLKWNLFLLPYRLVPWLGAAYSRACEYTCDRCGLAAAGDVEQAMRGLVVLAAGGRIAARVDLSAFTAQRLESGGFWATVLELTSFHPFLCKRAGALQELHAPATVPPVRRTVAGWILAPVLGSLGGGAGAAPLVMVATIGVLAAIAIPNFVRYQLRSKDAGAKAGLESLYEAQLALHQRTGSFRDLRAPAQAPGAALARWSAEEVAAAGEIDWNVDGAGYHAYTVAFGATKDGRQALAACAESDLDGDGVYAAWMVWHPVKDKKGNLLAPAAPCRFDPKLSREAIFSAGDAPGVPVRGSPEGVF